MKPRVTWLLETPRKRTSRWTIFMKLAPVFACVGIMNCDRRGLQMLERGPPSRQPSSKSAGGKVKIVDTRKWAENEQQVASEGKTSQRTFEQFRPKWAASNDHHFHSWLGRLLKSLEWKSLWCRRKLLITVYLYRWLHYIGRNNSDNTSARRISCIAPALYFLSSPLWQFVVFFWPDDVADLLVVMVIAREVFSSLVFWARPVAKQPQLPT